MDYKKAYFSLFNAVTDALEQLDASRVTSQELMNATEILQTAQQTTEELYIEA